jgi:poly(3-hydroxybutyrate) depolymerase
VVVDRHDLRELVHALNLTRLLTGRQKQVRRDRSGPSGVEFDQIMRRRSTAILGGLTAVLIVAGLVNVPAALATRTCPPHRCAGLPDDAPPALYRAEPRLPTPAGWPARNNAFSRTSGTGRYADGAYYWTDFLYDDHGTTTASTGGVSVTAGTPSFGMYTYPAGASHNNGADIFRAAVAVRAHASYWRVDWTTLDDPAIPIAEWTFDRDTDTATGGSVWPASAGVHSPGIDTALVMSAHRAELIDVKTGDVTRVRIRVDRKTGAFVARVPNRLLHPVATWRVRLASGLANPAGTAFVPAADAVPGQTAVYNVGFRSRTQEPIVDDYWDDEAQTGHLANGNVSAFSHVIRWSQLRRRVATRQPMPLGWSDRWYVSTASPGDGVITDAASVSDGKANYLGRVQPYAVYVPREARHHSIRLGLTFLLHSSNQNHNQYAATAPNFTKAACEDRSSICVTPLGRGPDGNYWGTAELDFWQVWHAVAAAYRLDPEHTVLSGYSMGGTGSNQIAMEHPDLFARSVTLAGGIGDVDSLANLRWVPTYLAGGAEDELVPVNLQAGEANALKALGYRFRWIVVTAIDHVTYELVDSFADAAHYMGHARRTTNPGRIDFTWTPSNTPPPAGVSAESPAGIGWTQRPKLGVRTTGAYWLRHLRARSTAADASVVAVSGARPDRAEHPRFSQHVDPGFQPDAATVATQRWIHGKRPARRPTLRLRLHNVRSLKVMWRYAGFRPGERVRLRTDSDGPTTLWFGHHRRMIAAGHHVVRFGI